MTYKQAAKTITQLCEPISLKDGQWYRFPGPLAESATREEVILDHESDLDIRDAVESLCEHGLIESHPTLPNVVRVLDYRQNKSFGETIDAKASCGGP